MRGIFRISIVVPLYNKEPHIKRAINSVLNQTIQDFEIVVVDDGSTDRSFEIVRNIKDSRIRLIQQENAGVSTARNRGVQESKSDLIAFLDADDEWLPKHLETILRLREKYPNAGLYATTYKFYAEDGRILDSYNKLISPPPWEGLLPNYFRVARGGSLFNSSSISIPKKVFFESKGFTVGIWWGEDEDLWARIALKYQIAFSWEVGTIYHQDDVVNNASRKKIPVTGHPFEKTASEAIINGDVPISIRRDFIEYVKHLQIIAATRNLYTGNRNLALRILVKRDTSLFYRKKLIKLIIKSFLRETYGKKIKSINRYRSV